MDHPVELLVTFSCSIFKADVVPRVPLVVAVFVDLSVTSIEGPVGVVIKPTVSPTASEAIVSGFDEAPLISLMGTGLHCAAHGSRLALNHADLHWCGDLIDCVQDLCVIVQTVSLGSSVLHCSVFSVYFDSHEIGRAHV